MLANNIVNQLNQLKFNKNSVIFLDDPHQVSSQSVPNCVTPGCIKGRIITPLMLVEQLIIRKRMLQIVQGPISPGASLKIMFALTIKHKAASLMNFLFNMTNKCQEVLPLLQRRSAPSSRALMGLRESSFPTLFLLVSQCVQAAAALVMGHAKKLMVSFSFFAELVSGQCLIK